MYLRGKGTIGDLLGDLVAYRSLRPCDERLAAFPVPRVAPRKIEPSYAQAVGELLRHARRLETPGAQLRRLIVVGDNAPTDGTAFTHLRAVNGWSGTALIVDEQPEATGTPRYAGAPEDGLLLLSRWSQLHDWAESPAAVPVDEATAVLLDIDKTLLGARGRNDGVIDRARAVAMREVIAARLGAAFDEEAFERARQRFNAREFHGLTGDNQDYVAYLCLVVASGAIRGVEIEAAVQKGTLTTMAEFVAMVEAALGAAPAALHAAHQEIAARIAAGDPTPFKEFRAREYQETVERMGCDQDIDIAVRLREELLLTGEVLDVARRWQREGALLFALSDKPDEASLPSEAERQQGYRPLHRTTANIVDSRQSAVGS